MKLVTAIVNKEDAKQVCNHLIQEGFSVTRLSTTGGFLMAGNMTLMIGTDDEKVDPCIQIIAQHCKQRTEVVPSTASYGIGVATAYPLQVTVGGATVFVTNVERFESCDAGARRRQRTLQTKRSGRPAGRAAFQ